MSTIFFLVKFLDDKDHANALLRGEVFVNRLSYFKENEDGHTPSQRLDLHEGTTAWLQTNRGRIVLNGLDITDDLAGPVRVQKNWLSNLHVYCVHSVHTGNIAVDQLTHDDIDIIKKQFTIPQRCLSLGRYSVVIGDVGEFIKRMKAAAEKKDYLMANGRVTYYDPASYHGFLGDKEAVFRKRIEYEYQREYRFAINTRTTGTNPITLEIGDIRDIAFRLDTANINRELIEKLELGWS